MKRFEDEVFALQIDPAPSNKIPCLTVAYYLDGTFLILENTPYSQDEKVKVQSAFRLVEPALLSQVSTFLTEQTNLFKDAPYDCNFASNQVSQYTFSIGGHIFSGSFLNAIDSEPFFSSACPKDDEKKAKWNDKVVQFMSKLSDILFSDKTHKALVLKDPLQAHYLRPVSRYLVYLSLNYCKNTFEIVTSPKDAIHAALKKAFMGEEAPSGAIYSALEEALNQKALVALKNARSLEEFDKSHSLIVQNLVNISSLSYSLMAYCLDLTYIYLLLEGSIIDERLVAYLHSPITPSELKDLNKSDDSASYHLYVSEGRSEWAPLHISPAYFYLESMYSLAHPEFHSSQTVGQA